MNPELANRLKNPRRVLVAVAAAAVSFGLLGTVAALWENPFFIRMVPAGNWEMTMLALLSALVGAYVLIRRRACSNGKASIGGVLGFVGIACPICNKILLLLFGGELLMVYFEPVRLYVAAFGVLITGWAVWREWKHLHMDSAGPSGSPERA